MHLIHFCSYFYFRIYCIRVNRVTQQRAGYLAFLCRWTGCSGQTFTRIFILSYSIFTLQWSETRCRCEPSLWTCAWAVHSLAYYSSLGGTPEQVNPGSSYEQCEWCSVSIILVSNKGLGYLHPQAFRWGGITACIHITGECRRLSALVHGGTAGWRGVVGEGWRYGAKKSEEKKNTLIQ